MNKMSRDKWLWWQVSVSEGVPLSTFTFNRPSVCLSEEHGKRKNLNVAVTSNHGFYSTFSIDTSIKWSIFKYAITTAFQTNVWLILTLTPLQYEHVCHSYYKIFQIFQMSNHFLLSRTEHRIKNIIETLLCRLSEQACLLFPSLHCLW